MGLQAEKNVKPVITEVTRSNTLTLATNMPVPQFNSPTQKREAMNNPAANSTMSPVRHTTENQVIRNEQAAAGTGRSHETSFVSVSSKAPPSQTNPVNYPSARDSDYGQYGYNQPQDQLNQKEEERKITELRRIQAETKARHQQQI